MVGVAQSVEPRIVIPVVVGSIPIAHPILRAIGMCTNVHEDGNEIARAEAKKQKAGAGPLAQLVEQLTLNQRVVGSIPTRPINKIGSNKAMSADYEQKW